jgi:hypothetical protein
VRLAIHCKISSLEANVATPPSQISKMCYPIHELPGSYQQESDGVACCGPIKQEVIDSLVVCRSAYEMTTDGVESVLERNNYELATSRLELLLRTEQKPMSIVADKQPFVMVRSSAGYILVACRGTFSFSDVVTDLKWVQVPMGFAKGKAMIGFVHRAMSIPLELFVSLLRAGEKLVFTGHSMGGAVCSLAALRLLEAVSTVPGHSLIAEEQVQCITFGTSPWANLELVAYVNSRYKSRFHNIVAKYDVVPRVHNFIPDYLFPAAKWVVNWMSTSWEVQMCKILVEIITETCMEKAVLQLEKRLPSLLPITWFCRFVQDCAAHDEEMLMDHVGYLLMLDSDSKDPESTISMEDGMENLGYNVNFLLEKKSVLEILYEHGLGHHYSCLIRGLSKTKEIFIAPICQFQLSAEKLGLHHEYLRFRALAALSNYKAAADAKSVISRDGQSLQQIVRNLSRACLSYFNQVLIRFTGNDLVL